MKVTERGATAVAVCLRSRI